MICRDIMKTIEERYPKSYAMEWDNVGLLVGRSDKEVKKVFIALDATDEVIDEAIKMGADMLITHHPLIFKALRQINDSNFISNRVIRLIQNDISYYAMHTNYDVMGMADLAGEMLAFEDMEVLEVTDKVEEQGIGRVADLKEEMTLEECAQFVKEKFRLPSIKVYGDPKMKISRMAVSPGSGKSVIGVALIKGADVLVTGDIDHHEGIDAVAQQMAVIDAGHYGIEHIFIEDMRQFCADKFAQLEVKTAEIAHPFWVL